MDDINAARNAARNLIYAMEGDIASALHPEPAPEGSGLDGRYVTMISIEFETGPTGDRIVNGVEVLQTCENDDE